MGHKWNWVTNAFPFHCCNCLSVTIGQPGLKMTSISEIEALLMNKVRSEPISMAISPTLTEALIHKIPVALMFSPKGQTKSRSLCFQLCGAISEVRRHLAICVVWLRTSLLTWKNVARFWPFIQGFLPFINWINVTLTSFRNNLKTSANYGKFTKTGWLFFTQFTSGMRWACLITDTF